MSNSKKPVCDLSPEEMLNIMKAYFRHNNDIPYFLSEVVMEFIGRQSASLGWMGMDCPSSRAVLAVAFGDTENIPEEDSNVHELVKGIIYAVYARAMKDCAALLGVESGQALETAVLNFAEQTGYGRKGLAVPLGSYPNLLADLERIADH